MQRNDCYTYRFLNSFLCLFLSISYFKSMNVIDAQNSTISILCIGDSITHGTGSSDAQLSYPSRCNEVNNIRFSHLYDTLLIIHQSICCIQPTTTTTTTSITGLILIHNMENFIIITTLIHIHTFM